MKALTTSEAIKIVDSKQELSFDYIEENMAVVLTGENEVIEGEALVHFIKNFLQYSMMNTEDEEKLFELNYAVSHRVVRGFSLNIVLSQCKGVVFFDR
ncbi:MAG TPA: hypothetical protein IAC02_05610 [Candidatus Coprovivens excrementavium]|nr:hypothetical protein [Candidatus Coprovivens excrementavium]